VIYSYAVFKDGRFVGAVDALTDEFAARKAEALFESKEIQVKKI
jgi:hypothetical protein